MLKSIAFKELPALPLVYESSMGTRDAGTHESTVEMFNTGENQYLIEWDIHTLGDTTHIGLWFDGNVLTDYDGIFSLPKEIIEFIAEQGFVVPEEFRINDS